MQFPEFNDRVALVTGAAGGIGAAVARVLADNGAVVAALDRDADRLRTVVEKLRSDDHRVVGHLVDITDAEAVRTVVERIEADLGPIDYLVNNAGVLRLGEVVGLTDDQWAESITVNATGAFLVSRTVVNRMVGRRRGAVVTVSSNVTDTARIGMGAYSASKAAVGALIRCLGLEVARYGIRCNLVAPGSTDTGMLRALWSNSDADPVSASIEGRPDVYRVGIPLGKIGQPEEVAQTVLFLLSERASHITMQELTVDGGATLGV